MVRACWDYYADPAGFRSWLQKLADQRLPVVNSTTAMLWNLDKRYMLELEAAGLPVVPSCAIDADDHDAIEALMVERGWQDVVRKPIHGQSGFYVQRLTLAERQQWRVAGFSGPALIQPYQHDIETAGETLLVYFDGHFSHAFRRRLAPGEWRSNSQFGATRELVQMDAQTVAQGSELLATAMRCYGTDEPPAYARVDGIVRGDQFVLMELELIEPALAFDLEPEAAVTFAESLIRVEAISRVI